MTGAERLAFVRTFAPGLLLLILAYALLTAFRDFRDNFSAEIWQSLGYGDKPSIFNPDRNADLHHCADHHRLSDDHKNNRAALLINHVMVLAGMLMVGQVLMHSNTN